MLGVRYGEQSGCGVVVDVSLLDFRGPELAWHAEDAAVNQGGAALPAPPEVSVRSLLETLDLTAFQLFEFRDGNLGMGLPGKSAGE
jgi:hypothetical protein